jgi:hypothetical protein
MLPLARVRKIVMHAKTVSTASIVAKMAAPVGFASKNPIECPITKMKTVLPGFNDQLDYILLLLH